MPDGPWLVARVPGEWVDQPTDADVEPRTAMEALVREQHERGAKEFERLAGFPPYVTLEDIAAEITAIGLDPAKVLKRGDVLPGEEGS